MGIGYGSDLRKAKEIMEKLYVNHPLILKDQPVTVFVDNLADSAVVIGAQRLGGNRGLLEGEMGPDGAGEIRVRCCWN